MTIIFEVTKLSELDIIIANLEGINFSDLKRVNTTTQFLHVRILLDICAYMRINI